MWDDWLRTRESSAEAARRLLDEPERRRDIAEGVAALVENRQPAFEPLEWPRVRD